MGCTFLVPGTANYAETPKYTMKYSIPHADTKIAKE
jgi:hypothetical protein